ncbi:MAG: hypothetical protein JWM27_2908 [Gemmatimonadetes bacterium]|nr:hypothetical protein [Gemmatimonadota bacterium]
MDRRRDRGRRAAEGGQPRRHFENAEADLLDRFYGRFERAQGKLVGIRHYTGKQACGCRVCVDHGRVAVRTVELFSGT